MSKNVVGLDPSWSAFGVADRYGNTYRYRTSPAMDDAERLDMLTYQVLSHCFAVDLVVMEGYSYGSSQGREKLGYLGETIKSQFRRFDIPFIVIAPSKLKKFATGAGNATKSEMKDAAVRSLGFDDGVSHDEADAAWLRVVGLHLLGASSYLPPSDRAAVLADIELPERK